MATYSKIKGDTALYLPVGTIMPWSKASVPAGFLYCDGSPVSRTTYADLFAVIGTTFGNPDASNFNLPDFQDRSAIGASNNRAFASKNSTALADQTANITFPSATRNMTVTDNINVTESANVNVPAHSHFIGDGSTVGYSGQTAIDSNRGVATIGSASDNNFRYALARGANTNFNVGKTSTAGNDSGGHVHNISGNVTASFNQSNLNASASAIDIENPYLAIRYMIRF